jgi:hypothetical protein
MQGAVLRGCQAQCPERVSKRPQGCKGTVVNLTLGLLSAGTPQRVAVLPPALAAAPLLLGGAGADACAALLQALVRWGGAMLELAHFKQGAEADDYIKEVRQH